MRFVEISSEEVAKTKTNKDFKKLLKDKYDAAREQELKAEILGEG